MQLRERRQAVLSIRFTDAERAAITGAAAAAGIAIDSDWARSLLVAAATKNTTMPVRDAIWTDRDVARLRAEAYESQSRSMADTPERDALYEGSSAMRRLCGSLHDALGLLGDS